MRRIRIIRVAATVGVACIVAALPAFADVENLSTSGIGTQATFVSSKVIDRRGVTATANVVFNVLDDSTEPPSVRVTVTETDDETGNVLFAGTASSSALDYQIGEQFDWLHLLADLRVWSETTDAVRDVDLNVIWNPAGEMQDASEVGGNTSLKGLKRERHQGVIVPMDAVGVVTVSDPDEIGRVFSATHAIADSPPAMWDTASSARLVNGEFGSTSFMNQISDQISASCTCSTTGYWSGYWWWHWHDFAHGVGEWHWRWVWTDAFGNSWVVS